MSTEKLRTQKVTKRSVGGVIGLTFLMVLLLVFPNVVYALTFRSPQQLGAGLDPSIAVDGSNVYAVYRSLQGAVCYPTSCFNDVFFTESTNGGASFSTPIDVSKDVYQSLWPVVASSGPYIYVAWENSTLSSNPQVVLSRSTDGGTTFGAATDLSNDVGYTQNIAVAASGSNVYIVWQDQTPGNYHVFYRLSTDYGADFSPTADLSNGPAGPPTLSLTASGSVYVAWTSGPGGVFVRRSTDGGNTFGATYTIAAQAGSRSLFATDSRVYAVWTQQVPRHKNIPAHYDVFFAESTNGGGTFSQAVDLSNSPGPDSYRPRVGVVGGTSIVYVAWLETTSSSSYSLFVSSSSNGGATFTSPPLKVSNSVYYAFGEYGDNGGYGQQYLAAPTGSSNVYLVWYQSVGGSNYEVYLARGS